MESCAAVQSNIEWSEWGGEEPPANQEEEQQPAILGSSEQTAWLQTLDPLQRTLIKDRLVLLKKRLDPQRDPKVFSANNGACSRWAVSAVWCECVCGTPKGPNMSLIINGLTRADCPQALQPRRQELFLIRPATSLQRHLICLSEQPVNAVCNSPFKKPGPAFVELSSQPLFPLWKGQPPLSKPGIRKKVTGKVNCFQVPLQLRSADTLSGGGRSGGRSGGVFV